LQISCRQLVSPWILVLPAAFVTVMLFRGLDKHGFQSRFVRFAETQVQFRGLFGNGTYSGMG